MKVTFFNIPTTGHVDPTLPLAAGLVQQGHEVTYYLAKGYQDRVVATGAEYRDTPEVEGGYFDAVSRQFNPLRLATQLLETTHKILPELISQLEQDRPDVVIYDSMCPWGRLVAKTMNIPAAASMSLVNVPPSYLFKAGQIFTPLKLLPRFLPWLRPFRQAASRLNKTYALDTPSLITVINWPGDLNICYTSREIYPQSDKLDDSYVFIGPPINVSQSEIAFPYDQLDPDRPIIYISLGTVFNNNPDFFQNCISAFRNSPYQVVMTLGRRIPVKRLGEIPPNFIVRDYVPQLEILKRADLFITHGGVNSIHQGLYFGVPLLLVPQQLEQALVAARLAELGVGEMIRQPAVNKIQDTADRILKNPEYKRRANHLSSTLNSAGGIPRAISAIETLVNHN
jgi:MGT family glycosyltransferase